MTTSLLAHARVRVARACAFLALWCVLGHAAPVAAQIDPSLPPLRQGDAPQHGYDAPFFPDARLDPALPTPDALLGRRHGDALSRHAEILRCFDTWASLSPRMTLHETGRTFEGRRLVRAILTSQANHARLDAIRAGLRRLDDPRGLTDADASRLLDELPAVAWLGYSIHGDELSGADAALAVAHHLAASLDADTVALLDALVVVIDPCMNPDGRERILGMVEQGAGRTPSLDHEAMQRGRWPWGRGNHYLFDMNRDWMTATQPETRARWNAVRDLPPQLFVDAHEMGELDTFLFYPQAAPHNPHLPPRLGAWQQRFGADIAAAFDAQGWPYYTREWADAWGPFYSDAWGSLGGAVGILYEQARTAGFALRDAAGQVRTYREAVHRQVAASVANLGTLARERRAVLSDFVEQARRDVDADAPLRGRAFVLRTGRHPERERALVAALRGQGVEVWRAEEAFGARAVESASGAREDALELPAGTLVIPVLQPEAPRVLNLLSFDVRMDAAALLREREKLERKGETGLYDVTAWSLPLLYDLDALWIDAPDDASLVRVDAPADAFGARVDAPDDAPAGGVAPDDASRPRGDAPAGGVVAPSDGRPPFAWAVDGQDDRAPAFAAAALEAGLAVHLADEAFSTGGRAYARGSLLVRRADNAADVAERVADAARAAGVLAHATTSGRSPDDGPDLGGGHFVLLARPRVALLSNMPVRPDAFGHAWYHLDQHVGVPVSMLDAQAFEHYDLRRYNVLVLPAAWDLHGWLALHGASLAAWVAAGGTLVAEGESAAAVAAHGELGAVVRRRDVLEALDGYAFAAQREQQARTVTVDLDALWGDAAPGESARADDADADAEDETTQANDASLAKVPARAGSAHSDATPAAHDPLRDPDAERQDAWMRRFAPAGVILRGLVNDEHWITAGCGAELPVLVAGDTVLLSREPVATPVRLADASRLRLSGLLWPEAAERLAESAYLTVESVGAGQIILFGGEPAFRGQTRATARLFANAVIYGPGAGTQQPIAR